MQANAVVLAVRNRKAVILANGGIYEEIPNQGYHVSEKIVWKCKKTASAVLRRSLMIAACLALLLTTSVAAGTKYLPWTYVSVALGETTVQYCLNARNEVLSAEADSEEGQTVLEQVAVSPYESIEDTMTRTLKVMRQDQAEEAPVHVEIASRFGDGKRAEDAVAEAGKAAEMEMTLEQVPWQDRGRPIDQPPDADQEKRPQPTDQQEQPMQEKREELPPAGAEGIPGTDRMEQTSPDGETGTGLQGFLPENAPVFLPDNPAPYSEIPGEQPDLPLVSDSLMESQNNSTSPDLFREPSAQSNEPLASDHLPESSVPETAPKNDSMPSQGFAADSPPMQDQAPLGDPSDSTFCEETAGEAQPPQQTEALPDAFLSHGQQADTAAPVQSRFEGNKQNNPDPMSPNTPNERKTEASPPFHQ